MHMSLREAQQNLVVFFVKFFWLSYFVGLISGLLPNRNEGRSSVTVPLRRRNFSVRSNPANKTTVHHYRS